MNLLRMLKAEDEGENGKFISEEGKRLIYKKCQCSIHHILFVTSLKCTELQLLEL